MSEHSVEKGIADVVKTYELLDCARTRRNFVIRDDQFDYEALLGAAQYSGRKRTGLSLLDTGRFGLLEVEGLARAGARILTSDEARPRVDEWEMLLDACRNSRTHLSVFWNGLLPSADQTQAISLEALEDLLRRGMDLHVSNRTHPRDAATLAGLAAAAKKGKGFLVVYHLGPLVPELTALAGQRAWVHFSDKITADGNWAGPAVEIAREAAASGARAAIHIERGLPTELLEELWAAGAALIFLTPPSNDRSRLQIIERKAARRKLPARAFYLSTVFLP